MVGAFPFGSPPKLDGFNSEAGEVWIGIIARSNDLGANDHEHRATVHVARFARLVQVYALISDLAMCGSRTHQY